MNEQAIRQLYNFLDHKGFTSRLGSLDYTTKKYEDLYVNSLAEVLAYARKYDGIRNIFIGRNPRLLDGAVYDSRAISFDIDPIRYKDTAANNEQHELALAAGKKVLALYPGGFLASSGNGALVIYHRPKLAGEALAEYYRKEKILIEELQNLVDPGAIRLKVDATNYEEAVIKLVGTMSTKGIPAMRRESTWITQPFYKSAPVKLLARVESISISSRPSQAKFVGGATKRFKDAGDFLLSLHPKRRDEYDTWLKVGMALKEFGIAGLSLWRDWSKGSPKYEEGICEEKWPGFRETPECTLSTLAFYAKEDRGTTNLLSAGIPELYFSNLFKPNKEQSGVFTGFNILDRALGSMAQGELSTFAARSGFGKTTFACTVAEYLRANGKKVLFFSTEMASQYILHKFVAIRCGIPLQSLLEKSFTEEEGKRIRSYERELSSRPIIICDEFQPSIEQVKQLTDEHKPDVIIFDHISQISTSWQDVAEYIKKLKALTTEVQCSTIVMSQLNEPPRNKEGGEGTSLRGDVRGSQEIIYLSSIFVYFNNPYEVKTHIQPVNLHVAKNRYGISGQVVPLSVDKLISRFMEGPTA